MSKLQRGLPAPLTALTNCLNRRRVPQHSNAQANASSTRRGLQNCRQRRRKQQLGLGFQYPTLVFEQAMLEARAVGVCRVGWVGWQGDGPCQHALRREYDLGQKPFAPKRGLQAGLCNPKYAGPELGDRQVL